MDDTRTVQKKHQNFVEQSFRNFQKISLKFGVNYRYDYIYKERKICKQIIRTFILYIESNLSVRGSFIAKN